MFAQFTSSGTQLFEIFSLKFPMLTAQKNTKELKKEYVRALKINSAIPYGNFDNIFGHFPRIFQLHTTPHAPCHVLYDVGHASRVLIGAFDPMFMPVSRL